MRRDWKPWLVWPTLIGGPLSWLAWSHHDPGAFWLLVLAIGLCYVIGVRELTGRNG